MSKKQSGGRNENSGLIDLDALLRGGDAAEPAAPVAQSAPAPAPAPAVAQTVPAARTPRLLPPVNTPPPRQVVARQPAESLDGISTPTSSAAVALVTATGAARTVDESGAAPASTAEPLAKVAPAPASTPAPSRRRALVAVAVLVAAAGVSLFAYRATRHDAASPQAAIAPPAAQRAGVAASPPAPAAAGGAAAFDPADLPAAKDQAETAAPKAAIVPARGGGATTPPPARPKDDPAAKVSAVVLPDGPARDPGDLGDAMRGAVGARATTDVAATTKEPGTSARTLRPSPGAVVGAINGVLPAARGCLGPDDPVRSASLTFRSDGAISRVDVSGGGHATDACVKSALGKARIEPFADESFVTRVTVRP